MVRIGLLGASRIARGAVIRPSREIAEAQVTCVAARNVDRAKSYATEHGIAAVAESYTALLERHDVDLIYNALPPREHAEWSLLAMQAGKDVLCEKPFAMNAGEARDMVGGAASTGRVLIEAFHYRFHPVFERVLTMIADGAIGRIEHVNAHFNVPIAASPGEIRYNRGLGGGALMDLGCYPLHWVRSVLGTEPQVVDASIRRHESGVDIETKATLAFPGGVPAAIACSMDPALPEDLDAGLSVTGSAGQLTLNNPLAPHNGYLLTLERNGSNSSIEVDGAARTTYWYQLQHVIDVLAGRRPMLTGGTDAIANMAVIDTILASDRS
ncbi:MAG: Gfo/Idh/MocA family oxidoreductase [Pseudomonadota bacterium]